MKTEVLIALKETEGFLSGQQLCERLGVSRTAVWKAIERLKTEGYEIESVRNKGYRLVTAPNVLSEGEIKSRLHTKVMGQRIVYFDKLESTNLYCRQKGDSYPEGTLVVANNQTGGRGSRGRGWESPRDVAVYMSLILKPDICPAAAPKLTLVMALSIAKAFQQLNIPARIKWPNDVVVNGKKVVGILTEMSAEVDYIHHVIVGVGINVLTKEFPEEIRHRATSLLLETGQQFSRAGIIAAVMDCFEQDYHTFLETCDLSQLLEQYIQFSATIGQDVRILDRKEEYQGYAVGMDVNGQLLVRKEDGQLTTVFADEVSVRGIYGYV